MSIAKILLERGADPNIVSDVYRKTALDKAENKEVIDLLIRYGAKTKAELEEESHYTASGAPAVPAENVTDEETTDVRVAVTDSNPPEQPNTQTLFVAIMNKNGARVSELIEQGEDVNQRDEYNYTPLMYAVMYNDTDIIKQLLDAGADVNAKITFGDTDVSILELAVRNNHPETAEILKAAGAKE